MYEKGNDLEETTGQFKKGKKGGPGRPKGARSKLGEKFLQDLYAAWLEEGSKVIQEVIKTKPEALLKVVASLLPKEFAIIRPEDEMTEEEMDAALDVITGLIERRGLAGMAKPTHGGEGTA